MSEPVEAGHASPEPQAAGPPPPGAGVLCALPAGCSWGFLPPSAASGRGGRTPWRWRNLTDSTDSTSARWSSSTSTVISPGDRSALGVIDESGRPFPSAVFLLQAHRRSLTARAPRPCSQSPRGPGNSRQPWLTAGLGPEAETGARPGRADPRGTRGRLLTVSSRGGSKSRLALLPFRTEGPTPPAKAPTPGREVRMQTRGPQRDAKQRRRPRSASLPRPLRNGRGGSSRGGLGTCRRPEELEETR